VARENPSLDDQRKGLLAIFEGFDALAVAFSGGADSFFFLAAAKDVLGDRLIAISAESPVHAQRESRKAAGVAGALGVRHIRMRFGEPAVPVFVPNPPHRCSICKQHVFGEAIRMRRARILESLHAIGFRYIAMNLGGYVAGSLNRVLETGSQT
jgi:uncharacterized protein